MTSSKKIFISPEEQKQLMLDMLQHFDGICRQNNIQYSLIGGSLIGAIRHHGYIPWDDDIDIVLTKDNYDKVKKLLDSESGRYQTLKEGFGGERTSFIKFVDTYTHLEEFGSPFFPENGVFLDIFCFYPMPNDKKQQEKQYKRLKMLTKLSIRRVLNLKEDGIKKTTRSFIKDIASLIIGYKMIGKIYKHVSNKYVGKDTKYVMNNWLIYGLDKEMQLKKNTEEYIDAPFENLTIMIFKNYDAILKKLYGDYMKLPPLNERVPRHNLTVWWKNGFGPNNKGKEATMSVKENNGKTN